MTTSSQPYAERRSDPWLFVEFIAIAAWLKDGDSIASIAARLRRTIPAVRAIIYGENA